MRKVISVNEGAVKKQCIFVEKLLKELNTKSRKISLLKSDDEMGDADSSKVGQLDQLALALENAINILAKL